MHKILSAGPMKLPKKVLIGQSPDMSDSVWEQILPELQASFNNHSVPATIEVEYSKQLKLDLVYAIFDKPLTIADYSELDQVIENSINDLIGREFEVSYYVRVAPKNVKAPIEGFYKAEVVLVDEDGNEYATDELPVDIKQVLDKWIEGQIAVNYRLPIRDVTVDLRKYDRVGYPIVIKSSSNLVPTQVTAFLKTLVNPSLTATYKFPVKFTRPV